MVISTIQGLPTRRPHRRASHLATCTLISVVSVSGCANIPYVAPDQQEPRVQQERQTGSNIARRDGKPDNIKVIDKEALESAMRGAGARRDGGAP